MKCKVKIITDDDEVRRILGIHRILPPSIPNGKNTISATFRLKTGEHILIVNQCGFERKEGEDNPNGLTLFFTEDDVSTDVATESLEGAYALMMGEYDH